MITLVVAEKDSVARAIADALSEDEVSRSKVFGVWTYRFRRNKATWISLGLRGHIFDFDFPQEMKNWYKTRIEDLLRTDPVLTIRRESLAHAKALSTLGKDAKDVVLALDADAEGEGIAYEVMMIVSNVNPGAIFRRALFSSVTKEELRRAFSELRDPNPALARKVFTRMMADLTIGAVFTRMLTLTVRRADRGALPRGRILSYGPCQTPVLNLVVQRALERESFKPEKYYLVHIKVNVDGYELTLTLTERLKSRGDAEAISREVVKARGIVDTASYVERKIGPPKPLDTIELERRASRFLNIRAKVTLDIAEELYRRGFISYPRTETNIYPSTLNLREILRKLLSGSHGDYARRILSRPIVATKGDSDDGAHPPIHPTRGATEGLIIRIFGKPAFWSIYDLVVRHFLATLSPPGVVEDQEIKVNINGREFAVKGLRIIEQGYWIIYPFEKPREHVLPRVRVGDPVEVLDSWVEERETEPPPYLSESELLKLMRRYGIGTDATMQDHIHTNIIRNYFIIRRKQCIPTPLGRALISALKDAASELVDPQFRSRMEKILVDVSKGLRDPRDALDEFRREAQKNYAKLLNLRETLASQLIKAIREYKN